MYAGTTKLSGDVRIKVRHAPGPGFMWQLKNRLRWGFIHGWLAYHLARPLGKIFGFMTGISRLSLKVHWHDGTWTDYGVVSYRVVTTAFVTALATALHTQASPGNLFYHAFGVGTGNEAVGDTGMGTELTTEYNPDGTRPTGTHTSAAGVYESVATLTIDAGTPAVTEHGVMGAASGASTLVDRSKFAAINLIASDSIVSTYDLTLTAGG
jgi:hypothetical protein